MVYETRFWWIIGLNLIVPFVIPPLLRLYEILIESRKGDKALHWWRSELGFHPNFLSTFWSILQYALCVTSGPFLARVILDRPIFVTDHIFGPWDFLQLVFTGLFVETSYYWVHRFLHWKPVYPYFHQKHHLLKYVTVWSAYYGHAVDYLLVFSWFPTLLHWIFPRTLFAVSAAYCIGSTYVIVAIHSPSRELADGHHALHHLQPNSNFATYLCFLDKLFGTAVTTPKSYDPNFSEDKEIKME